MKKAANIIIITRIVFAVVMVFTRSLSIAFMFCYTICGISDAIDGTVARKTGSVSSRGAQLDSVADVVFMLVAVLKLMPDLLNVPVYIYWLAAVAFVIRSSAYICGTIRFRKLLQLHTYMNKVTGACLFLLPYIMLIDLNDILLIIVCIIAIISSIEEFYIQIRSKKYDPDVKTFIYMK